MNPTRNPAYQVQECLRLASFLGPDRRLYSNAEIAERLGEATEWVRALVGEESGWQSPPRRLAMPAISCVNMTYDPGHPSPPHSS